MFAENNLEELDSQNQSTEEVENTVDVEETVVETETEDTEPEYTEHEKKLYKRAREAEAELKELKAQFKSRPTPTSAPSKSGVDAISAALDAQALIGLHKDDISMIADFARKYNISLTEARSHNIMQAAIKTNEEERRSAETAATGATRRSASKVSSDRLLESAQAGSIPDDADSLTRIASARLRLRKTE